MEPTIVILTGNMSDIEVLDNILTGRKELFEIIIRRYNQRLYRIGMSVLNNNAEAEDAMQNAYIKAYEHLPKFERRSSFSTWLIRIMLNECLLLKKRKERYELGEIEKYYENKTAMKTPANILMNKELGNVLEGAINQLPEKYRIVFVLREIEEMSVRETGEILGLEEPNVKVRLNRAKTMLRDSLNSHFKEHVYAYHLSRCDKMVNNVLQLI